METGKYYYKVASPEYIEQANNQFNDELSHQFKGHYALSHINHLYHLGFPGLVLQAAGFPDNKIEMLASQLYAKSIDPKHPFNISSLKNLVRSLNDPIAVFVFGSKSKAQNVIIEQEYNDKKFLIGVHFNQEHRGTRISDIRGIHPRDTYEILNWIQQGKLLYVDKDKIQDLITKQRINPAEVNYLDLDFVAKVVNKFENPNFSMENVLIMEDFFDESKNHVATGMDSLQARAWQDKLAVAGIEVGSRFRIERLCNFNDMQVKGIDFEKGKMTFFHPTTHPDYQGEFDLPIDRVLDNIKFYNGSRWIQVDNDRREIVVSSAESAIMERAKDPSPHATFSDAQLYALNRYTTLYSDHVSKESIFTVLLDLMKNDLKSAHIPDAWVNDVRSELTDLAHGIRRESSLCLKR